MKHWKLILGLLAVVSFNGCMSSSTDSAAESGLSGTLVDAQGTPVADALVKAYAADTSDVLAKTAILASEDPSTDTIALDSTWTDAKGQYHFSNLKSGDYNLKGTLYQNGDTLLVSHVGVRYNSPVNVGTDTLKAPGLILIQADWNGTPISGVHCTVLGSTLAAVSDDSGRCLIVHVLPGVFQVQLTHNGYFPDTSGNIRVYSNQFTDAGILTMIPLPDSVKGCWNLQQSNGYYGTLFVTGQGGSFTTDSVAWVSAVTGEKVGPGVGTGTDSSSSISFALSYTSTSAIGYYSAEVKGDSLINGIARSSAGDGADWFATRITCPD